jgi:hypothetical protein
LQFADKKLIRVCINYSRSDFQQYGPTTKCWYVLGLHVYIIVAKHECITPATVKTLYSVIIDNDYEDKEDYYGTDDKVKLYLWFINEIVHTENVWGSGGIVPAFLISALDGGQWSG